jgi:hypothetical protein
MAIKIGSIGEEVNYDLRVGDTFGDEAQICDENGVPVDLTGATFDGALSVRDASTGADIPLVITPVNLAIGKFRYGVADTSAFAHSGNFFRVGPMYAWLLKMIFGGRTETLFYGLISVAPRTLP